MSLLMGNLSADVDHDHGFGASTVRGTVSEPCRAEKGSESGTANVCVYDRLKGREARLPWTPSVCGGLGGVMRVVQKKSHCAGRREMANEHGEKWSKKTWSRSRHDSCP
jgi:hypothetical protein